MQAIPAITGKQLLRLLEADGWQIVRRANHGLFLRKGSAITVLKDTRSTIPNGTLSAILGPKQTGLGREGLASLIQRYGLR